jgi:hypothetical protein
MAKGKSGFLYSCNKASVFYRYSMDAKSIKRFIDLQKSPLDLTPTAAIAGMNGEDATLTSNAIGSNH